MLFSYLVPALQLLINSLLDTALRPLSVTVWELSRVLANEGSQCLHLRTVSLISSGYQLMPYACSYPKNVSQYALL